MERWSGRVALVTGASSGIGSAVTKALVRAGVHVVGAARNLVQLEALGDQLAAGAVSNADMTFGRYLPVRCDLRLEADIVALFQQIRSTFGRLDICVNNAGLAKNSPLLNGSTDHWREMLDVNVLGLSLVSREAVQLMFEMNIDDGHIVNMGSMSGHRVLTNSAIHFYSGSKFMVRALTEGLRQELRELKRNIRVSLVSPGLVETQFTSRMMDEERAKELYSKSALIQPEDVARVILDLLAMPTHVEVNDVLMRPTEQAF